MKGVLQETVDEVHEGRGGQWSFYGVLAVRVHGESSEASKRARQMWASGRNL